jgi:hypothetical protein
LLTVSTSLSEPLYAVPACCTVICQTDYCQ